LNINPKFCLRNQNKHPSLLGKQKQKRTKQNKTPKHKCGALVNTPRKKQVSCKKGEKNKLDSQPRIFAIIGHVTLTLLLSDFWNIENSCFKIVAKLELFPI
jgi:hypothetical protein